MKIKNYIIYCLLVLPLLWGCSEYEDYVEDYDYSAVYFGTQKPLRTVVARDVMQFKFGVALGGKRENTVSETAKYVIDPNLLQTVEGADQFTLLPTDYYTLSDDGEFVVSAGEFIGDVTLTLDKALFTADPDAVANTYALPVRVTEATTDTVLAGMDYSIIVVKYISPYHGTYYSKGVEYELDGTGTQVNSVVFSNKDLSKNMTKDFSTLALNTISTDKISAATNGQIDLTVGTDNSVEITTTAVDVSENNSVYDSESKTFFLDYKFEKSGTLYHTLDTLILRQDPEADLRFEEW
ncbi:DUF1735 domain-containing protein [Draconibacterium sediminis]|nr:DUF1735 domain-containing protein [Draconibacterium sediminis]